MPLEGELGFSQNVFREEKVWCSDVFSLCSRKLHWLMPTDIWKTIFSFMPNLAKKNLRFSWLNQIYQYLRCIQNLSGSLGWANTLQQMANRPTQNDFQHLKVKMGRKERMEGEEEDFRRDLQGVRASGWEWWHAWHGDYWHSFMGREEGNCTSQRRGHSFPPSPQEDCPGLLPLSSAQGHAQSGSRLQTYCLPCICGDKP